MTEGQMEKQFVEVTQKQFYAAIGPMNVHPRCERMADYWETPSRQLMGITTPGYMCEGPKSYRIDRALIARATAKQSA